MRKIAKNCVCFSESLNFKIALKSVQEITSKSPPKISNICFEKLCLPCKGATILKNYTFKTPPTPGFANLPTALLPNQVRKVHQVECFSYGGKSLCSYLDFESYSPNSFIGFSQLRLKA